MGTEVTSMRRLILIVGFCAAGFGCASNPNKAKNIDTKIDKSDTITGNESVGVNKDGNMVVQNKVRMSDELRRVQYEVYESEDKVYGNKKYGSVGLYGALKDCRAQIVSKKFGGNGKLIWTEPVDRVTDKEDDWNIGVDEHDKIVGVSEEFLKDRLARFKKYKDVLGKRETEYQEKLEICDADLKAKREHAGPDQDTQ